LKGLAATGTGIFGAPAILSAGIEPIRIGFLTVKTGPLASGGIQMEQGLTLYLKERNSTLAGSGSASDNQTNKIFIAVSVVF
jgi:branched-chain amino acid transport system substrate-binding protein